MLLSTLTSRFVVPDPLFAVSTTPAPKLPLMAPSLMMFDVTLSASLLAKIHCISDTSCDDAATSSPAPCGYLA